MTFDAFSRAPSARRAPRLSIPQRRAHLLRCALKAFARKGIGVANHADVAAEAGVAVPTVFGYFPTRADLLTAVVLEVERFVLGAAREAAATSNTASGQMIAVLRDFADSFDNHPEYARIWVNWGSSFQEDVWPLYRKFVQGVIDLHRGIISAAQERGELDEDVDPEMSAFLFIGASTAIIQMKMEQRDPNSIARYLETTIHGALHQK